MVVAGRLPHLTGSGPPLYLEHHAGPILLSRKERTMRCPLRALSLLAGMACALTLFASSPSQAYDDGTCQPNCVCPHYYNGPNCSYGYPYGFDYDNNYYD